jgi:hypothetical protein
MPADGSCAALRCFSPLRQPGLLRNTYPAQSPQHIFRRFLDANRDRGKIRLARGLRLSQLTELRRVVGVGGIREQP